jgi:tRNA pseudouridine32 synthase/23S rRNA pseudouridine746 synthase
MLDVVHRSADLIAINKPSGIALLADRSGEACLWDELRAELGAHGQRPFLVHRLDKGTSGVLLVALDAARQAHLTRQFQRRAVRKFYLAKVVGDLDLGGMSGVIDLPLTRGRKSRYRVAGPRAAIVRRGTDWRLSAASAGGHPSITRLRRLAHRSGHTDLLLQPLTGRTHQLRVHLAWIGHPIVGDSLYGRPDDTTQRWSRLALHCHRLVVDGVAITATPPPELRAGSGVAPEPRLDGDETGRGEAGMSGQRQ